jgi:cytoskeletal protein CcmA (bactofilin family)
MTLKRTISLSHKSSVNGKLISETNKDSVHISFTGNVKELNCNTCDIDGDAFTVHGNSVKGNVGGSIEANSIEVGGNVQGDIDANSVKIKGRHTGSINV